MAEPVRLPSTRHPAVDPYVATWVRIIRRIEGRELAEAEARRRRISIVSGGREGGTA